MSRCPGLPPDGLPRIGPRANLSRAGVPVATLVLARAGFLAATLVLASTAFAADLRFRDRLPVPLHPEDNPYQEYQLLATGPLPHDIAAGDIDGDGHTDLAVAGRRHDDIWIFLGDGDGGWRAGSQLFLDGPPGAIRLADLNGDSRLDILATDYLRSRLYVWRNRGDGTFEAPRRVITGIYPADITTADFNGDGRLDVATAEYDVTRGSATIFLTDLYGWPAHRLTLDLGLHAISLDAGDIDADGHADLAVACSGVDRIIVLYGAGDGTFERRSVLITAHEPYAVALLDVNRDGFLDVAAACEGEDVVSWFPTLSARRFDLRVDIPVGHRPWALVAADWNEDGRSDLVVANRGSHTLSLLESNLEGELHLVDQIAGGDSPSRLALIDVNNDRRAELISLCAGEGAVRLFRNESTGTAIRELTTRFEGETTHLRWSIAAGREDAVTCVVLRRDGGGSWITIGPVRSVGASEYELVDPWPSRDDPQYRLDEYESGQLARSIGPIRVEAPFGSLPEVQVSGANPLQGSIEFRITILSPGELTIRLFDIQGRHVVTLLDDVVPAGRHRRQWDGRGEGGTRLASGIYLARIEGPGLVRTVRMVLRR